MNTRQNRTVPSAAGRRSRFPRPAALALNVAPAPRAAAPLAPAAGPAAGSRLPAPPGDLPASAGPAPAPAPIASIVPAAPIGPVVSIAPAAPLAAEKPLTVPSASYPFLTDMKIALKPVTPSPAQPALRRTTRNMAFDPVLLRVVRRLARREGISLSAWVCRALARDLREHRVTPASPQYLGQPCALLTCREVAARLGVSPGLVSLYSRRPGHPLYAARYRGGRKKIGMFFPAAIEALARGPGESPAAPAAEPTPTTPA